MDPLAELHYDNSPYVYVLNNPLKYIDPTGCDTIYAYQDGTEFLRIEAQGENVTIYGPFEDVVVTQNDNPYNPYEFISSILGIGSMVADGIYYKYKNHVELDRLGQFTLTYNGTTNIKNITYLGKGKDISKAVIEKQKIKASKLAKVGNTAKIAGHFIVVGTVVLDGVGVLNYYKDTNAAIVVSPKKAGVNTIVTGLSYWLPALGLTNAGINIFYDDGWKGWARDMDNLSQYADENVMYGPKMLTNINN